MLNKYSKKLFPTFLNLMENVLNRDSGANGIIYFKIICLCQMRCVLFIVLWTIENIETKVLVSVLCFLYRLQHQMIVRNNWTLFSLVVYYLIKRRFKNMFFSEKQKFLCNKRFAAVFAKTSLHPVIKNRNSLKKLISKTKIV